MAARSPSCPRRGAVAGATAVRPRRSVFELLEDRRLFCLPGDYFDVTTGQFVYGSGHDALQADAVVPAHTIPVVQSGPTIAAASRVVLSTASIAMGPAEDGAWAAPVGLNGTLTNGNNVIHASVTPQGKLFYWDFWGAHTWDPATLNDGNTTNDGSTVFTNPPPNFFDFTNDYPGEPDRTDLLFCAGHSWLADGRLFVTGGQGGPNGDGSINSAVWNPTTSQWTVGPDMNQSRWYPTNTTLANGEVLIVSGRYWDAATSSYGTDALPQVYNPFTNTLRNLTTAQLVQPLYPFMYQAPDGRVFDAGPQQQSRYLDTTGTGQWTNAALSNYGFRDYGTSVMYRPGKVMIAGGSRNIMGEDPTDTVETIDLNAGSPAWQYADPMANRRRMNTATILPDGTVLMIGGTNARGFNTAYSENPDLSLTDRSVYAAELWNPDAPAGQQWTTLASMNQRRLYHSTVVLLPDGRIMAMGGGDPSGELLRLNGTTTRDAGVDTKHSSYEVYSPPYLFNGARPTITTAPTDIGYAGAFTVTTPDANISKVTLVKLTSVTHGFNMDQRFDALSFTRTGNTITATGPAGPNTMPPGHYMLFLINDQGVPSVAKIVELGLPGVGALASPPVVEAGGVVPLTATEVFDAGGFVTGVSFYRESNGTPGLQIGGDTFISTDTTAGDGYTAVAPGLGVAAHTFYAAATDNEGNTGPAATSTTSVDTAPRVTGVRVRGSAWNPTFLPNGYAIPMGSNQVKPVSWVNLNQVIIQFDHDVAIDANDLVVTSGRLGTYPVAGVSYNPLTFTATFTLATTFINDKIRINLNGETAAGVFGTNGLQLDGEFTDTVSTLPSGNGTSGGSFRFRLAVLPGDVNRTSSVTSTDLTLVRNAQGKTPTSAGYSPLYDIDGSGAITATDVTLVRNWQNKRLAGDPAVYTFSPAGATFGRRSVFM